MTLQPQPHDTRWWMQHRLPELGAPLPYTRPDGTAALTAGYRVARFIETLCRQIKGRDAGQYIRLRPWQVDIILEIFECDDRGVRRYRRGLLGVPRKNGKSMLGAALALYALVGDGEEAPEVYSCAGDREQAKIVFREAVAMVKAEPALAEQLVIKESTAEILYPARNGRYKALSAEAYTKEGLNPSFVVFDEVHVQPNDDLWTVMSLGSATRDRFCILGITTAGFNKKTLCGKLYDTGRKGAHYRAGAWHGRGNSFFCWYEARDPKCDHRDPAVWRECNPGLGDFLLERAVQDELDGSESLTENQFRRYRLNQWTSSVEAWLPHGAWDALAVERRLARREECVIFIDGSFNNDSTGMVACTRDGFIQTLAVWEKPSGDDEWRVPISEVEAAAEQACKDYRVLELPMDPFRWQRSMEALERKGLPVVEFPTTSPSRMVPACQAFYEGVVIDRTITHDGSEALARHIANARLKTDRLGPRIVKEHQNSANKIDLAVCAVGAYARAMSQPAASSGPHIW